MAAKAALLAPVGPIMAWGVQRLLSGQTVVGVTAIIIGAMFTTGFVVVQEYDIPYEEEIIAALESASTDEKVDAAQEASERVGEYAESHAGDKDNQNR